MKGTHLEFCLIGAGPRGLSVLERFCAQERHQPSHTTVLVHVVEPADLGAGAVWRPSQSRLLLTNTVASQLTVYTDDSVHIDGPIEPGPSLYEWARSLALLGRPDDFDEETLAEASQLGPDSYPTRAFYGHYLRDSFRRIVASAPKHVAIRMHHSRAVAIADTNGITGGPQGVRLEDGTRLHRLDAVVLAQGHVPARLAPHEARAASLARIHHLDYLVPGNPADIDLDKIAAGRPVLLRGLGLNFFDYMALLTLGRGGKFVPDGDMLSYEPSGQEPILYASSRRGVPYQARGNNQKGAFGRYHPVLLTPEFITALRKRGGAQFGTEVWPLIAAEVETVYYRTLLTGRDRADDGEQLVEQYLRVPEGPGRTRLLDAYDIEPAARWDWERILRPYHGLHFGDRAQWRDWLLNYLTEDVLHARSGNVTGPLKAALDVLRDLRNEIRLIVDHSGLTGDSHRDELDGWYTPMNAFLSVGPPVSRIEEMIALINAGVLELTGPGTKILIDTDDPAFIAESSLVPGPPIRAQVLIEARLPEPDLRRTADPLLQHMLDTEQCRTHRITGPGATVYETGGLAVTERPYRVLDGSGRPHPRRFAYGVPTESVHWVTAAGIRPGVDSVTLGDSDAICQAIRALPPVIALLPDQRAPVVEGSTRTVGVIV